EAADLMPKKHNPAFVREALGTAREALGSHGDWSAEPLEETMRELAEQHGWKRGALYMTLRVAVTCRRVSTPLFETMAVIGKPECLERIETAMKLAAKLE
ncbi:MAG: glutamate--tRNA ligase, partial [Planctomycetota bacterium]